MSYSCTISFKTLKSNEIYPFLQKFKTECINLVDEIARENYVFSPIFKKHIFKPIQYENIEPSLEKEVESWAKESIFKFRWFYLADLNLLGVYGIYKCLQHMFDNTIYFQNSCDQDYEFDEWKGIPEFEEIANKYKNMSDNELINEYSNNGYGVWDGDDADLQYWAKTFVYDKIWDMIKFTLFDDDKIVYLSIFGYYDFLYMQRFLKATIDKFDEFIVEYEKKKEGI